MKEQQLIIITIAVSICLVLILSSVARSSDFYAYYTRLDYDIPIESATDYIPQELTEESREILARVRALAEEEEGEEWRASGPITGKYADIIVNLAAGRQLVFSRESRHLPYWETEKGK
jgi:hypothetical protein